MENIVFNPRRTEQFNGREGETATLFSRCPLPFACVVAVSPHVISAVRRQYILTQEMEETDVNS